MAAPTSAARARRSVRFLSGELPLVVDVEEPDGVLAVERHEASAVDVRRQGRRDRLRRGDGDRHGPPPHENVTTPPPASAAFSAASVQEPGVPLPTTPAAGRGPGRGGTREDDRERLTRTRWRGDAPDSSPPAREGDERHACDRRGRAEAARAGAAPRARGASRLHSTIRMRSLPSLAPSRLSSFHCRSSPARPPRPRRRRRPALRPPPRRPVVPTDELHWLRDSAEYRAITIQTYRAALEAAAEASAGRPAGSWAISVDADETIIDNSTLRGRAPAAGPRPHGRRVEGLGEAGRAHGGAGRRGVPRRRAEARRARRGGDEHGPVALPRRRREPPRRSLSRTTSSSAAPTTAKTGRRVAGGASPTAPPAPTSGRSRSSSGSATTSRTSPIRARRCAASPSPPSATSASASSPSRTRSTAPGRRTRPAREA